MITAWMVYALLVGSLLGGSGLALERFLRTHGLPSRWIWAGAILLSMGLPLGHWGWKTRPQEPPATVMADLPAAAPQAPTTTLLPIEPIVVEIAPESVLRLLDGPVMAAWALTTGALLLFFAFLFLRTHHLQSRWRREDAGGHTVLISDEWGPAVVGFLRPRIVLPGWCRDIDAWALEFILDHELEHIRAGDLRLTILAGMVPVLFPWNLPLWWQLARLRTAVEADCDLRVLGRNPGQTKPYVELLLAVGERAHRGRPMAAMLSEPYETLKRRIRLMTMPMPKKPWIRGGLLAGVGGLLVAAACLAPGPTDGQSEGAASLVEAESFDESGTAQEGAALPIFTPFTVRPAIRNQDEVVAALVEGYPPLVRDAGIGGRVTVWFFVDEEGQAQRLLINESSGHQALDEAALRAADVIEFTPALNRDQPRPVWVSVPIEFTTGDGPGVAGAADRSGPGRAPEGLMTPPSPVAAPDTRRTGEIAGTVTDARTGEPLGSVQLFVMGTGRGTLSGPDGRYVIQHVPVGAREVFAQLIGYGESRGEVSVAEEEREEVNLQLQVTAVGLEPLLVRGTPRIR